MGGNKEMEVDLRVINVFFVMEKMGEDDIIIERKMLGGNSEATLA